MTTIIKRNAFLFDPEIMGENAWPAPPRDVAYYERPHCGAPLRPITWADIHAARTEKQNRILRHKRFDYEGTWRPVKLEVRFFDQDFFGGWQTYIHGVGGISHWIRAHGCRRDEDHYGLMALFPLKDGLLPPASFYHWEELFAHAYQRGTFCKRPRGVQIMRARISGQGQNAHIRELQRIDNL